MIITDITQQRRKQNRYNLFSEDGFVMSLSDETIVKNGVKTGIDLSGEQLERLRREDTLKYAKELAAAYVSRGLKTRREVMDYLKRKEIDELSINEAVSLLESYGLIDDEEYAKEFSRIQSQKCGAMMVKQKLLQKGISPELAEKYSKENEQSQRDAARVLFEKYSEKYSGLPEYEKNRKIYAALLRRGFSYDEAARMVKGEDDFD